MMKTTKLMATGLFYCGLTLLLGQIGCGTSARQESAGGSHGGAAGAGGAQTGGSVSGGTGGGSDSCPPSGSPALACSPGTSPSSPLVTDFTPGSSWCAASNKWGKVGNLVGSVFPYKGTVTGTTMSARVDTSAGTLHLTGDVSVADYAGGGLAFDACVSTTSYAGIEFKLDGQTAGCTVQFQVQTYSQQATSNRGGCNLDAGSCYNFPKLTLSEPSGTISVRWSDVENTGSPAEASALSAEIVGLQWQLQSDGATSCTGIDLTIDDVKLIQ